MSHMIERPGVDFVTYFCFQLIYICVIILLSVSKGQEIQNGVQAKKGSKDNTIQYRSNMYQKLKVKNAMIPWENVKFSLDM